MTYEVQDNALEGILELLCEEGFDGLGSALEQLLNELMKMERGAHLRARPTCLRSLRFSAAC